MKKQLHSQKVEKEAKKDEHRNVEKQYHKALMAHLDVVDQRETEKQIQHQ